MSIDTKKILERLGPQTLFVPTRTDKLHTISKKEGNYNVKTAQQLDLYQKNTSQYGNAKILANSAPDGFNWVVIDYDDHKGLGSVTSMAQFDLHPTFTVKTPTGAGKQEWYLCETKKAELLHNNRFTIPGFEGIEIFLGQEKHLFVAPGCVKENGEYIVAIDRPLAEFPSTLFNTLLTQQQARNTSTVSQLNHNDHYFKHDIDNIESVTAFSRKLHKILEPYELGVLEAKQEGDGRDNFIFEMMCEGFTFNLSKEKVMAIVSKNVAYDNDVISDPNGEFTQEVIQAKCDSAWNNIQENHRSAERMVHEALKVWDRDEYSKCTITFEQAQLKARHLSLYSHQECMNNEQLRKLVCELIVKDTRTNMFHYGTCLSKKTYDREYAESLELESKGDGNIEFSQLLQKRSETELHWLQYDAKGLKEGFRYYNGTTNRTILDCKEFLELSHSCVVTNHLTKGIAISNSEYFYPKQISPLPPSTDATKEELARAEEILDELLSPIVGTLNPGRDKDWVLDRYALLIQNPVAKIDNAVVFLGPQGSGKTLFAVIMRNLFPRSETAEFQTVDDLVHRFTESKRLTFIEDVDLSMDKASLNTVKAKLTSSETIVEKKFHDRVEVSVPLSYHITTNDEPTDLEIVSGRRWTIMHNQGFYNIQEMHRNKREILYELKTNDWRQYRVIGQLLYERVVTDFKSNYKTEEQKIMIAKRMKGTVFAQGLANLIMNYGYVDNQPAIIMNSWSNRRDYVSAMKNHYFSLVIGQEPNKAHYPPGMKWNSKEIVDGSGRTKLCNYMRTWLEIDNAPLVESNFDLGKAHGMKVRGMKQWIETLSFAVYGSSESDFVETIIENYGFQDQWEWDNTTKPEIENLGNINIFDHIDLGYDDDEEF